MKVLILSASVGAGHMRAAQAIEEAFRERHPAVVVKTVDVLDLTGGFFRTVYGDGYLGLANKAPHLLGYLYDLFDGGGRSEGMGEAVRRMTQRWFLRQFPEFIRAEKPDLIINTHFLPAELLAHLKKRGRLNIPQATVVTDFEVHRFWTHTPCERFFVATPEGAATLRGIGVSATAISVTGIPIHPLFSHPLDQLAARTIHGLRTDSPVLLQLAGGQGMGPIEEIFGALLEVTNPAQIIVVAGRNEEARARLKTRSHPGRHHIKILGFTDKIHELMAAADLVISKPGGLTTSEALARGVPIVAVNPIPGQESRNCDYLLENGAGIKINALSALPGKIDALLADERRLQEMRTKAAALGKPTAAYDVAQQSVRLVA